MASPILRATALLFGSSTLSLLLLFIATKLWTMMIGPVGLGMISLHQSLVALTALVAGLGMGVGVVRLGAGDAVRLVALRAAAWRIFWRLGVPTAIAMWLCREPLARWVLGGPQAAAGVGWMALALLCSLAAGLQNGLMSAHHQVGALSRMNLLATALGCTASVLLIMAFGEAAIPWAVLAIYASTWLVSRWLLWRSVERQASPIRPDGRAVDEATRELIAFGAPYTASLLVGAGVLHVIPVLVLHGLGAAAVGFYRGAVLIADNALGGLLNVMVQDYYPRVAATQHDMASVVNQQHHLILTLALPLVLGLYGLAPWLVPLAYSGEFTPMLGLLEWLLVASLIKFASWSMSFVVLARSPGRTFFLLELSAGATNIAMSVVLLKWLGLPGLGIAALVTAVVYYAVGWAVLKRQIGFALTARNRLMLVGVLGVGLGLQALPALGLAGLKTPLALAIGTAAGLATLKSAWALLAPRPTGE